MILALRMAWRNLWRHSRRTWLTALAMVFSNVLLIFLITLQFGSYDMMINNTLRAYSGHAQVQHPAWNESARLRDSLPAVIDLAADLRQELARSLPGIQVAARASAFALASSAERSFGIQVVGVEPEFERGVSTLPGLVNQGRYLEAGAAAEIVLGSVMARNLKVGVGDEITLLGSGRDGSFAAGIVRVAGIFDSGVPDLDRGLSAVPLRWFQETFTMGDHGHAVVLSLADLAETARAVELIRKLAPPDSAVLDWQELQPGLKQAIQADLSSAWFMYAVLVVLVAFSVLNTQLMSVLERTREFGMVMALGIRPGRMAALVMLEATLMAALGLALGLLLGWAVAAWFEMNGFTYPGMAEMADRFNLPARIYPAVNPFTMMMGPAVVFLFSVLASLYPALRLFRLQPVQAMRAA